MEPYLYLVKNPKYRIAISKIRTSSHKLEIERGRYTRPKTPTENRLCHYCNVIENEMHFMLYCSINEEERGVLLTKIEAVNPHFKDLPPIDKFVSLLTSDNEQMLKWIGRFIHNSFIMRELIL